jgi:hypothetical protein
MTDNDNRALVDVLLAALALQSQNDPLRPEVVKLLADSPVCSLLGSIGHAVHYGSDGAAKLREMYEQLVVALRNERARDDGELSPGDLVEVRTGRYAASEMQLRIVWVGEGTVAVAPRDIADDYVLSIVPLADVSRAPAPGSSATTR